MAKTLIFCFDGTGHDPENAENYVSDKGLTNILKLHLMFGKSLSDVPPVVTNNGREQQSFYYSGVGTYGNVFRKFLNSVFAPEHLFSDVKKILDKSIEDLKHNYVEDDHVVVFGYSRGAAVARRFVSCAKKRAGIEGLKIDFLGVFETVAAITTLPRLFGTDLRVKTKPSSKVVFENDTMSSDVVKAVHLLALDENRIAFQPTLFKRDSRRIKEVWMPGTHGDVGGGVWNDGLSDLSLLYMIERMNKECGDWVNDSRLTHEDCAKITKDAGVVITKDDVNPRAFVNGVLHEHTRRIGRKKTLHPRQVRVMGGTDETLPIVHDSVKLRFNRVVDYRPYALKNVHYVLESEYFRNSACPIRLGASDLYW